MSIFSEDVIKLFEVFKENIGKYQDLNLEEIEFEYYQLNDLFEAKGGSSEYKKEYITKYPGEYPLLTGKLDNESIEAYINTYDFEGECVTYNKDNAGGSRAFYRPKGFKFSMNSHHVALFKKQSLPNNVNDLDYKYSAYALNRLFETKKYGWEISANWDRVKEENIPIPKPIGDYTPYDIQKIIAEFIEYISLKSESVISLIEEIIKIAEKGKENLICKLFNKLPFGSISEDVIKLFELFKKNTGNYQDLNLEEIEFEYYQLNDLFEAKGGSSKYKKEYITNYPGKYPLLTGKLDNESIEAYINTYDFEGECVTYNKDNAGGSRAFYRPKGFKFSMNSHHVALFKKQSLPNNVNDLDYKYSAYALNRLFETKKYGWEISANWDRVKEENIPIPKPIGNYTSYDIQKIIAEFIEFSFEKYLKFIIEVKKESDFIEEILIKRIFN